MDKDPDKEESGKENQADRKRTRRSNYQTNTFKDEATPEPDKPPKKNPPNKKKKRQSKKLVETETVPSGSNIDPDEPTYCLCNQISFGDMVGCDNDLCPIEWYHFTCIGLTNKPKGKWFCPRCRGDKSTVMKPKAQFMKELEKYQKEKDS